MQAAQQAALSSRKGFQAGTRTQVDVLNALQRVAAAVGELDDGLFARINGSLGQP